VLGFNLVVFGCLLSSRHNKGKFATNVIQVEMQCCHLYITYHVTKATNVVAAYRAKHEIIDNDMV